MYLYNFLVYSQCIVFEYANWKYLKAEITTPRVINGSLLDNVV